MKRFIARVGARPLAVIVLVVALGAITTVAVASTSPGAGPTEIMPAPGPDGAATDKQIPGNQSPAHLPTTDAPRPNPLSVTGPGSELGTNFAGQTFHNQRREADVGALGANQLSLEPPDQGLCVGNGELIETVNDIVATYNAASGAKTSPATGYESLNQFYTHDHQIDRNGSAGFGTFLSDPRCLYDASTGHFFMSILSFARDSVTGAFEAPSKLWIATSKTGTPTASPSDWNIVSIDTTNDGSSGDPTHPGCPCFGDQPLIGIDKNGVYITTNEFPINGPGFNGAQIYALQKSALVAGTTPHIVRIEGAPIASTGYGGGLPYSLQPTTSPSAGDFATADNGTEYLLGALEFGKKPFQLDNRLAVWALTNTESLNSATPSIGVKNTIISSETYGFPPAIVQPNGPTPQADSLKEHENLIDGGDDRMQVAIYAHHHLWGASDTIVKTPTRGVQVGVAYYMVSPSVDSTGAPSGAVVKNGYVSVNGNSVTRPSLGVTSAGKVVLGASLIGPDYFPSAAYTTFDDSANSAPTTLHVAAAGTVPADGFSGFRANGASGVERWGDYGFAAVDGNSVWVANEWIPGENQGADLAAWGTYVSKITP
jgi:hypothetical protein